MALLDFQHQLFGRNKLWGATVGTADLPASAGIGDWTAGDVVLNLAPAAGSPSFWFVSAVNSSGTPTFLNGNVIAGSSIVRTVAGSTTIADSDHVVVVTAAGTVTLPAPATSLSDHQFFIKATAQPVTITPASGNLDGGSVSFTISTNQEITAFTDGSAWFTSNRDYASGGPVRTITAPGTILTTDSWVVSNAGQLTLAPTAGWVIGRPIGVNASAASVTITPASGTLNGAAALTLGANARALILFDGTAFFAF